LTLAQMKYRTQYTNRLLLNRGTTNEVSKKFTRLLHDAFLVQMQDFDVQQTLMSKASLRKLLLLLMGVKFQQLSAKCIDNNLQNY